MKVISDGKTWEHIGKLSLIIRYSIVKDVEANNK